MAYRRHFSQSKIAIRRICLKFTGCIYRMVINNNIHYQPILQIISKSAAIASILLFLDASTNKFAVFLWFFVLQLTILLFFGTSTNKFGCMLAVLKRIYRLIPNLYIWYIIVWSSTYIDFRWICCIELMVHFYVSRFCCLCATVLVHGSLNLFTLQSFFNWNEIYIIN